MLRVHMAWTLGPFLSSSHLCYTSNLLLPIMSEPQKHNTSQVHTDVAYEYPKDEKHKAASSPSSGLENGQDVYFGINEKALLRKLDLRLLPAVTLLYLLSFLDRSNGTPLQSYPLCLDG